MTRPEAGRPQPRTATRGTADAGRTLVRSWRASRWPAGRPERGSHRLSGAQRGIWLFEQIHPGTTAYTVAFAARLDGPLAPDRLRRAAEALAERHPALRTTFEPVEAGDAVRRVRDDVTIEVTWTDLTGRRGAARAAARLAQGAVDVPFDLADGPLARILVYRTGPAAHLLVFAAHHLVCDGGSLPVVLDELAALYDGAPLGPAAPPPVSVESAPDDLDWWRDKLAGVPALDLPADRVPPAEATYTAASVPVTLPADLVAAATEFGRAEGATLFMVLLAAFQATLGRFSAQHDFAVGVPEAGRGDRDTRDSVGLLANALVMRADLAGHPSLRELVGRVRRGCLDAYAHRDAAFADVVTEAGHRSGGDATLTQATFAFHPGLPDAALAGTALTPVRLRRSGLHDQVELHLRADGDRITGTWDYRDEVFDAATATRMADYLDALLRAGLTDPDAALDDLDVLTDDDRRRLGELVTSPASGEPPALLHDLVAAQARRTPGAPAVVAGERALTYAELDAQANQLAHLLRERGAGPERVVGLRLRRGVDLAVGLLGILRSEAAYLPLDPDYPAERLDYMCADSDVCATVTEAEIDAARDRPDTPPPPLGADPASLAYIIYTSGSTGTPKGVLMTHGGAVEMIRWALANYRPTDLARVLAATSICFDLSVFEFFAPLSAGGTAVVVDNALTLLSNAAPDGVTLVNTVPSAAREIVAAGKLPPGAAVVNLAGEALPGRLVHDLYATGTVREIYNLYGPSETTTYSTAALVRDGDAPPIGRPLPGERAYVLNDRLRPVPVGAIGHLYLGGDGVSRGYHRRPGLTASRYLPDPYAAVAGARMYRTGDVVRYRTDGQLVYLGRRDLQVKLRGHRIELGEIEARLHAEAGVRDAAAAVRDGKLVAYVVGDGLDPKALRDRMRAVLPGYLVPQLFVALDALPLNPNGKLDRAALPAPARTAAGDPPRGPAEELVAAAWRDTLGTDAVGRDDDFFDLGGHSLLAGRVATRLTERLGTPVPMALVFAHPVLADLATALPAAGADTGPVIPRVRRDTPPPASAGQRRLWFLAELDPAANAAYGSQAAVGLRGPVDAALLQSALDVVVARHETLRTGLQLRDGALCQIIAPDARVRIREVDTHDIDALAGDAAAAFDLATGPLLRVDLAHQGPDRHVLLLTVHHTVSDGWSLAVLGDELSRAYRALRDATAPDLPDLPVQYADYAAWSAARDVTADVDFWRDTLAGLPDLDPPLDRPRPPRPSYRGARVPVALDADVTDRLDRLARDTGTTRHMVLLAAWQALLARWCGQRDFGVGTVVAGRPATELEPLIGFFANSVVLRADVSGRPTFRHLLDRVRDRALAAYAHADVPFDRLVAELAPRRGDAAPLFQTSFAFQNTPEATIRLDGVRVEPLDLPAAHAIVDIGLSLWPRSRGVEGFIQYAADLFDAASVDRLAAVFTTLLRGALERPDTPVADLAVDTPITGGEAQHPPHVADAVDRWAARTPDAVAVRHGRATLSYRDLAARVRTLAGWLAAHGVAAERVVGVDLSRTPDLIVALLAVWRAGGAFLPLDCGVPAERREFQLRDSDAVLTLTDEVLAGAWRDCDGRPDLPLDVTVERRQLCHVMYTSGSTGTPKAVLAEHEQLLGFLGWAVPYYLDGGSGAPLQTPVTFDLSFAAMFGPLMSGHTITLLPPEDPPIEALPAALAAGPDFSFVKLTPAHLALLDGSLPATGLDRAVRRLVVAGEALTYAHLDEWARLAPGAAVVNEYGPTETVVGCFRHPFAADGTGHGVVPIGRPGAGTHALILDDRGDPVVPGGVGELCIGGVQVGRGYLNRAGLTAAAFRPDPTVPGARLYRTGDLVRERADGAVLFLGRRDGQVKVRGYRIELGEVESALRGHPGIRAAAVNVAGEGAARMLVAYVATVSGVSPDEAALRAHLRRTLPEHMVPALYVPIRDIPLTPSGKVDRRALPVPTASPAAGPAAGEDVRAIWQELLHRDGIGDGDDFFALGGHSLLATALVARLRDAGYATATVRGVFDHPTLGALCAALGAPDAPGAALPPAERRPGPAGTRLADASPGQERLWLLAQLDPASTAYAIQGAVHLTGPVDADLLAEAFAATARRHESLRTTFRADGERIEQVIHAVPAVRLDRGDAADLDTVAADAAAFDLTAGPLVRLHLLDNGDDRYVLLLTVHHIIADGASLAILADEIGRAYAALADGRPPTLADLPAQYADVAAAAQRARTGEDRAAALGRWRDRLAGAPPLALLADRVRPARPSHRGGLAEADVPADVAAGVARFAETHRATGFMVLLAAYLVLLSRYGDQPRVADISVGVPVAGRDRPELEPLIGFFMDTVVLRQRVDGGESFADLVGRVRETALDGFADQDVPFEDVLRELRPERDASATPLFQVMFNQLTQARAELRLPGVTARPAPTPRTTAKVDLELYAENTADGRIHLALAYACDLFDPATAAHLVDRYATLLAALLAAPGEPVSTVGVAPPEPPPARPPFAGTVLDQFAAQAAAHPDRVAIWTHDGTLTYADLLGRVRHLGHRLAALPPGRIGIVCEPGPDVAVALLGTMAGGHAYVPLDPAAPAARRTEIATDAGLSAIVSRDADTVAGLPTVELDDGTDTWHWTPADPDTAAYVLHTSGSTGTPKGVVQSHRGVARHVAVYREALGITAADRLTLLAAYTFDAAVLDLYAALTSGATCIPLDLRGAGPAAVRTAIADARATVYHSTPTVLRLLREAGGEWPDTLRAAVLGGEELTSADLLAARADLPDRCTVANLYGATECTLAALHVTGDETASTVPIGRPVPGVALHLVDADGAPAEAYGELVCVAPHVAAGYLGGEPFDGVYRTGDLAVRRPDGGFRFAGRRDGQLKIAGRRIDTAEVEARLRACPGVRDAAVTAVTGPLGQPALVGYVTGDADPDATRASLYRQLPHYLVPALVVTLPTLPATSTGKIDRHRLPDPAWPRGGAGEPPATDTERAVAAVLRDVLDVPEVGRHDDFFALGGHSLQATQVVGRLADELGVTVPMRRLFERPTVAGLAAALDEDGRSAATPIPRSSRRHTERQSR